MFSRGEKYAMIEEWKAHRLLCEQSIIFSKKKYCSSGQLSCS